MKGARSRARFRMSDRAISSSAPHPIRIDGSSGAVLRGEGGNEGMTRRGANFAFEREGGVARTVVTGATRSKRDD